MIHTKTKALKKSRTLDRIVQILQEPTEEDQEVLEDFYTEEDMYNMMFLDPGKGIFDTSAMVDRLIEEFTPSVIDKEDFARHHLLS